MIEFIPELYKQGNREARRDWPAQNKREAGRCGFWVLEGEAGNNISSENAKQSMTMKKLKSAYKKSSVHLTRKQPIQLRK